MFHSRLPRILNEPLSPATLVDMLSTLIAAALVISRSSHQAQPLMTRSLLRPLPSQVPSRQPPPSPALSLDIENLHDLPQLSPSSTSPLSNLALRVGCVFIIDTLRYTLCLFSTFISLAPDSSYILFAILLNIHGARSPAGLSVYHAPVGKPFHRLLAPAAAPLTISFL